MDGEERQRLETSQDSPGADPPDGHTHWPSTGVDPPDGSARRPSMGADPPDGRARRPRTGPPDGRKVPLILRRHHSTRHGQFLPPLRGLCGGLWRRL